MKNANVNYTPEMVSAMLEAYANGATVESIAESVGKTVRSVVAKLAREGVYKTKEAAKAKGRVNKQALADKVAALAWLTPEDAASLAKNVNARTLVNLLAALEAE